MFYFIILLVSILFVNTSSSMTNNEVKTSFHASLPPPSTSSSSSFKHRSQSSTKTVFPLPLHRHYGAEHDDYLFSFRELFEPRNVLHNGKRFVQNFSYIDSESGDSVSLEVKKKFKIFSFFKINKTHSMMLKYMIMLFNWIHIRSCMIM